MLKIIVLLILLSLLLLGGCNSFNDQDRHFIINNNGEFSIINDKNIRIIDRTYEYIDQSSEGVLRIYRNYKWGFLDNQFNEVIRPEYSNAQNFSSNLAAIQIDAKWGYINSENDIILPAIFDWAGDFIDGVSVIKDQDKYFFIEKSGEKISSPMQSCMRVFSNAYIAIDEKGNHMLLDSQGNHIIALGDDIISVVGYYEDMISCEYTLDGVRKYKIIDVNGNVLLDDKDSITPFVNARAFYGEIYAGKMHWSLIGSNCKKIVPARFMNAIINSDELLGVQNAEGKWGFIDTHGALVIDYLYTQVGSFCDGYAPIAQDFGGVLRWGIIDLKGEIVIPFEYDYIYPIRKE